MKLTASQRRRAAELFRIAAEAALPRRSEESAFVWRARQIEWLGTLDGWAAFCAAANEVERQDNTTSPTGDEA